MPNSPVDMWTAITINLPQKTGRSLEEWVALVQAQDLPTRRERLEWLKREHKLGHSTASIITQESLKPADYVEPTPEEHVERQYAGARAGLRPIYEWLIQTV